MGKMELDQEWVQLIREAREVGIQKEAISLFLKEKIITDQSVETKKEVYE